MTSTSRPAIADLVHQALVARVRMLLGQSGFEELMATQERVSQALAVQGALSHSRDLDEGAQALAQAVLDAMEMDSVYYGGSDLSFIVSEGLTSAGLALGDRALRVVAEDLPGPGSVFLEVSWRFLAPVGPGDEITAEVTATSVR